MYTGRRPLSLAGLTCTRGDGAVGSPSSLKDSLPYFKRDDLSVYFWACQLFALQKCRKKPKFISPLAISSQHFSGICHQGNDRSYCLDINGTCNVLYVPKPIQLIRIKVSSSSVETKKASRSPSLYPLLQFSLNTFHEFVIRSLSQHNLSSGKLQFNVTGWSLSRHQIKYTTWNMLCAHHLC